VELTATGSRSADIYICLLAAVGLLRLAELRISARRRQRMLAAGGTIVAEPGFPWMVALHSGLLLGCAVEVVVLHRPLVPVLAAGAGLVFVAANAVRWWVIATLGDHWNVGIVDSAAHGVIATGPYRWVRHPNYAAVFLEMAALPLLHTAWLTALVGTLLHAVVLRARIVNEEDVLMGHASYATLMGSKPRFVPRPWRRKRGQPRAGV